MSVEEFYIAVGGDYKTALSRMMNDDFIKRMLGKFVMNNGYNSLIEAYEANDIPNVFSAAHSLKGVAGNLALNKLFEVASVLCEATRGKETAEITNEVAKLKNEYNVFEKAYNELVR